MLFNSIETRKYRGAYIQILNYWQDFVIVVFYRGKFYQFKSATDKKSEYTNEEYILVLKNIIKDAEKFIDAIKNQRSIKGRIKLFINNYAKKRRKASRVPQDAGQIGERQKSPTQGV